MDYSQIAKVLAQYLPGGLALPNMNELFQGTMPHQGVINWMELFAPNVNRAGKGDMYSNTRPPAQKGPGGFYQMQPKGQKALLVENNPNDYYRGLQTGKIRLG